MFKLKQAGKDKVIGEKMKGEKELEMYLNEIPQVTSLGQYRLHQNHHQNMFTSASVSPISLSPFSSGFYSSEDGSSPSVTPFGYQTPTTNYLDSLVSKNSNGHMSDDFGLSENLSRMHIGDEHNDCSNLRGFGIDPDGFRLSSHFPHGISPYNVDHCYPNEGFNGYFRSPVGGYSQSSYNHNKATLLGLPQGDNVGTSMDPYSTWSHSPVLYSDPSCQNGLMDYVVELRKEQERGYCNEGIHLQNPSMSRPCGNDALYHSQKCGIDINGERNVLNPLDSYQLMNPKLTLGVENPTYNRSMIKQKPRAIPNCKANPAVLSKSNAGDIEGFNCEDSFIIQGKRVKFVADKQCDRSRGLKKNPLRGNSIENRQEKRRGLSDQNHFEGICENNSRLRSYSTLSMQPTNSSLLGLQGIIYFMAKDQYGCRFLQKKFDEGTTQDVQLIFNEIIDHVVELMVNPFGNYLVQKLMEVCSEEQRMQIVLMVTEDPRVLVRICLNTHG